MGTMAYSIMPLTPTVGQGEIAFTAEKVGLGGCVTHNFPEENDGCVNIRLVGFEQHPSSCASSCGCAWQCVFPSGEELQQVLPPTLARKMDSSVCDELSWRLNQHCRRYITGAKFSVAVYGSVFFLLLLSLLLPAWKSMGILGREGAPNWIFYPGVQVVTVLLLLT